jgi:peptide/nickel transport system substrate-binding protein/oligopeptide transport system substrate-binding protein
MKRMEGLKMGRRASLAAGLLGASLVVAAPAGATPMTSGQHATRAAAGVTTFSISDTPLDHLTPQRSELAFQEESALFSALTDYDANGKLFDLQAQSVTSKNNVVWTIKLRPGWTFHNGEPVTSSSFINAWNAAAYGPNAWPTNAEFAEVKGYAALNPTKKGAKPTAKTLAGLKAVNPLTIRVTLSAPDSQFPLQLSQLGFLPLPKAAFTNPSAFDKHPIGNGPYEMVGNWSSSAPSMTTKRYPGYKGTPGGVDQIVFKFYSNQHTAYNDVLAGNLDMAGIGQDQYAEAKAKFGSRFIAFSAPAIDYMAFPLYDQRFQDIRVRHALSMAIDRKAISTALFAGVEPPATDWLPPAVQGGGTNACGQWCQYNPTAAKALLDAAGGLTGTVNIWFPGGFGYDAAFQAIANQWHQNLGLTVNLHPTSGFSDFFADMQNKTVDGPMRGHWGALYPSAQNFLNPLYKIGGEFQYSTGYSSQVTTNLINEATRAPSLAASVRLYQKAVKQIAADFPTAPLYYAKYVYVVGTKVHNLHVNLSGTFINRVKVSG